MALIEEERARIRYHLGYLNTNVGPSIGLGVVSASQPLFLLESAMNSLRPEAEAFVRRCVIELDCIEDQLSQSRTRLANKKVNDIEMNPVGEQVELESQYGYWSRSLADTFGVPINPFSKKHQRINGEYFVVEPM